LVWIYLDEIQKDSGKPKATVRGYYNILNFHPPANLPNGVFAVDEVHSTEIGYDSNLLAAMDIFKQICGEDVEFLPERKEPNPYDQDQDY
jgi:hypothetical protein